MHKEENLIAVIYHSNSRTCDATGDIISTKVSSLGFQPLVINAKEAIERLEDISKAQAIIFGSPTYFGSVATDIKAFMDATSEIWYSALWKDKIAGAFTYSSSASGDKLSTINQFITFTLQHGMVWVGLANEPSLYQNTLGSWSGLMIKPIKTDQHMLIQEDIGAINYYIERIINIVVKMRDK